MCLEGLSAYQTGSMYTILALSVCLAAVASGYRLPYIIEGRDAEVGEFPWQASLQRYGRHSCGAALITPKWLITAAHCVGSGSTGGTVLLGAHDIKTLVEGNPTDYDIEKMIKNTDWDSSLDLGPNDIGLIKLKESAIIDGKYVKTIRPAPADAGDLIGANCTITGWGKTKIGSIGSPNILQAAATTPMSKSECQAGASKIPDADIPIYDSHICVAGTGAEGACHGDSGGPLTCTLEDGSIVLAGETSGGDGICNTIYPSIYTRISSFRQWLADNSDGDISLDL